MHSNDILMIFIKILVTTSEILKALKVERRTYKHEKYCLVSRRFREKSLGKITIIHNLFSSMFFSFVIPTTLILPNINRLFTSAISYLIN